MYNKAFEAWKIKIKRSGKEKRIPVCGQFELTPRCNLDCKMCYIHNQNSNSFKHRELSTEQWKRIFDEAYDTGMMFATLTGGECLLREDFKELYLHLWNKHVLITVFTNGILLDDTLIAFFQKYQPDKIQISLYGSSEEGYRNVTGHTGFKKVISNIEKLQDAGLHIRVTVTPSKYNIDDYIETVKLVNERGWNTEWADIMLLSKRDDPTSTDHYLSCDEIVDLSVQRAHLLGTLHTPIYTNTDRPKPYGKCTEAPRGLTCNAGNGLACVIWDGTMYPCANVMAGEGASLLSMHYTEAWERTKTATDEIVLAQECVGCAYENICPKCPAFRLNDLNNGHCNPDACELTCRLVAAGVKKLS